MPGQARHDKTIGVVFCSNADGTPSDALIKPSPVTAVDDNSLRRPAQKCAPRCRENVPAM